jgi:predicted CopG family antitoxin
MTSRNISIRDDLYERLTRLKRKDQSYSDFIESMLNEGVKGSFSRLMKYFGIMSDIPEEIDEIIAGARARLNDDLSARKWSHLTRLNDDNDIPR